MQLIRELREENDITQEVFYNDTGINIGRIERAKRDFSMTTLNNICKYSGYYSLGVLKRIPILPIQKWTDEMLFEYFELTQEEIELINSVK